MVCSIAVNVGVCDGRRCLYVSVEGKGIIRFPFAISVEVSVILNAIADANRSFLTCMLNLGTFEQGSLFLLCSCWMHISIGCTAGHMR